MKHTWDRVCQMRMASEVIIATDSEELREMAQSWGATVKMTDPKCLNGTERVCELMSQFKSDFFVNVQADEVFVDTKMLDQLVDLLLQKRSNVLTPVFAIKTQEELMSPQLVKCVRNDHQHAVYFSRSPIPFLQGVPTNDWLKQNTFWGHVGVYSYSRKALEAYNNTPPCRLEKLESLEMLRFFEHNIAIDTMETEHAKVSINTPEDLVAAHNFLRESRPSLITT